MRVASPDVVTRSLAPLSSGYRELFDRVLRVSATDQRVRALWLAGSVGRGVADAGSDLDVVVTVADDSFAEFCRDWRDWLARVTETIIAREIPGLEGSFYSVSARCERFDVVVERLGEVPSLVVSSRLLVLDRDGLTGSAAELSHDAAGPGPDATRLAGIVEEFFRQQAIFLAAVVARRDWLLGVVGVVATQRLLYDVFVEANQPLPMMGIKQWSARLTPTQRALLESLPVPNPVHDEVITAMLAVRRAMLSVGRETAERYGVSWPVEMDQAVAAYYANELGTSSTSDLSTSPTTRIERPGE